MESGSESYMLHGFSALSPLMRTFVYIQMRAFATNKLYHCCFFVIHSNKVRINSLIYNVIMCLVG